ncbi:hypothetical protein AAF712_014189 [Marasmius tenuissimus]|uniref:Uncharacterized protein n=1 Tax=Marasmius tenuissimus TaxID=585030 RepID=A0ABR2ZBR7_9AGAR
MKNTTFVIAAGHFFNTINYGSVPQEPSLDSMVPEPQPEESTVVKALKEILEKKDECFSELSHLALEINTNIREIEGKDPQSQGSVAAVACDAVFAAQALYSTSQQESSEPQSARLARFEGLKQTLSELRSFSEAKRSDGAVYSSLPFYNADEKQMNDFSLRLEFHIKELYATDDESKSVEPLSRGESFRSVSYSS